MDYTEIKHIHMAAVACSATGFAVRGLGALRGAAWVQGRVARTLPHMVDTVLLTSALSLAWMARINPLEARWLLAKIIGLLGYIALGLVALRGGSARPVRAASGLAALLVLAWMVSVAVSKNPAGFLGGWL